MQRSNLNLALGLLPKVCSVSSTICSISSAIEAGRLDLEQADFSLRTLLNQTLRALALRAHKKGLELACHVECDVPDGLVGDGKPLFDRSC